MLAECTGRNDMGAIARIQSGGKVIPYGTGCWSAGGDGFITLKIKSLDDGSVRTNRIHSSEFKPASARDKGGKAQGVAEQMPWEFSKAVGDRGTPVCALSTDVKVGEGNRSISIKAFAKRDHLNITLHDTRWKFKAGSWHKATIDFDDKKPLQAHVDANGAHQHSVAWHDATPADVLAFLDHNRDGRRPGGARNANHCRSEGAPRRYTRAGPIRALQLDGPGPNQRRKLEVPPELADALTQWMIVRRTYLKVRTLPTLFCSKRGGAITPNSLLHLVKSNLQLAANRVNAGVLPPRAGPQVIRNTRLVLWLNDGVPAAEVAIRAGLKNIKGLGHLREVVNPGVRLTLSHGRDDDNLWDRLTPEA
ncbi:hypothetical protein JKP88DRAFT_322393 [Tribonema minus]|uniref:Uncharacterized protein n=1 Tax=Tribonema minus TaxID=303371 RepID=A0A836CCA0_9STRA|nr:hypothetical protein JKP88DRAFT_322393 [Tribonema minus]